MARRRRKGTNGGSGKLMLYIGAGVLVLVLAFCAGKFATAPGNEPTPNFRIADYRQNGSRFASAGNSYIFDGKVENIETIGNARIVSISLKNNPANEILPLLVPGHVKANITRGNHRYLFETSCRTGRTADGEQVKGVLIVKKVEPR